MDVTINRLNPNVPDPVESRRRGGAEGLQVFPVLHHMMCAYVGPQYDFGAAAAGYVCPKCRREIVSGDPACEIVGMSARCVRCSKEMMVSPPTASPQPPA
jgi:DNA-directed RNA polymerase subunit RPC12/RpoP